MGQHDYDMANQAGSLFRADLNNFATAVATNNSGAAAPSTIYAYEWWADTTSGWLKQRNAANSAWIRVSRLASMAPSWRPVQAKASTYTILETEVGNVFRATAALTFDLTAAATLGDGWWCEIKNASSGNVIIDPATTEQINGANTYTIGPGASVIVVCSGGTAFYTTAGRDAFSDDQIVVRGSADATKELLFDVDTYGKTATQIVAKVGAGQLLPPGILLPYAGNTIPPGTLLCDGTTGLSTAANPEYAGLFTAIGTTWGGTGATDFDLPDLRSRGLIGDGTGETVEAVTASSANGFSVVSNTAKWFTGMEVRLTNLTGFTTTATAGPIYYAVRTAGTILRLATTLALAQNEAPDITVSGTGTATLTSVFTARTLGQYIGEESHAMSKFELLSHAHTYAIAFGASAGGNPPLYSGGTGPSTLSTNFTGGNVPMNNIAPSAVVKYVITY